MAGPLFVVSLAAHLYVKVCLRPKNDSDFDNYYYEFEEQHPVFARYEKWSRITFVATVIAVLLLFVAAVI